MANTFALYFFFTIPSLTHNFFVFVLLCQCLRTAELSTAHTNCEMVVTLFCLIIITTSYIHYIHFIIFHFFFCVLCGWLADSNQLFNFRNHHNVCIYAKNKNNANILLKLNVYFLLTALSVYEAL